MVRPIIDQTISTARRSVLLAVATTIAIIGALAGERLWSVAQIELAALDARQAVAVRGDILMADEALTMSASMAAATGEAQWINRYYEFIPIIDEAIALASTLAEPSVAEIFDEETRAANDILVGIETRSFVLVRQGLLAEAQAILDTPEYLEQKSIFADGLDRLTTGVVGSNLSELATIQARADWIFGGLLIAVASSFWFLWRALNRSLAGSRRAYYRLERDAGLDPLTGLPNRRRFFKELDDLLANSGTGGQKVAVIMLDLDGFKPINDRYGHEVGDRVLAAIGRTLQRSLSPEAAVARFGGDEFVCAIPFRGGSLESRFAATRILDALTAPVDINGSATVIGASAGIAVYPDDGLSSTELIHRADIALYRAKLDEPGSARLASLGVDGDQPAKALVSERHRQPAGVAA